MNIFACVVFSINSQLQLTATHCHTLQQKARACTLMQVNSGHIMYECPDLKITRVHICCSIWYETNVCNFFLNITFVLPLIKEYMYVINFMRYVARVSKPPMSIIFMMILLVLSLLEK